MTDKEALILVEQHPEYVHYKNLKVALEKQIEQLPNLEGDGYADGQLVYDTWICPRCDRNYEVGYDIYKYCPNCGQKIDRTELRKVE